MARALSIPNALPELLSGPPTRLRQLASEASAGSIVVCVSIIFAGAGAYGAAMGVWRAPEQAVFNAVKFPLVILCTALGNGLINAMLGPLLGAPLRARDSLILILMSYAVASAILGSFAPLLFFQVWNIPSLEQAVSSGAAHGLLLLTQVVVVAFAGIMANLRLFRTLESLAPSRLTALRVLFAWLTINLFLGAQLCWNARPFIGSPGLPVQFLRPDAFDGNFYEAVISSLRNVMQ